MRGFFVTLVIVAILAAAPFVAFQVWGFDVRVWAQQFLEQEDVTPVAEAAVEETPQEPVGPLDWMQDDPELLATFTPDKISDQRYIVVEQLIEPDALLTLGEALPDPSLIELYASARAPGRMIGYCAEVLDTVADTCDVTRTEVRDNRDGRLRLLGRLGYTTPIPLGEPEQIENGALISAEIALPFDDDLLPTNAPATRVNYIQQAQDVCDALRARFGNCAMTQVNLKINELWITDLEVLPAGTDPQRLEATARYSVYADSTEWDDQSFSALVSEIANPN